MNFRRSFNPVFIGVALLMLLGCASKKRETHDLAGHTENTWKEMDDFHIIMAETFHPYKDSANLEPVKTRASELMTAADQWASARVPEKVDREEVRDKLERLKSEAAALAERVKSADDDVIGAQLSRLHDTFHEIQEMWYGRH